MMDTSEKLWAIEQIGRVKSRFFRLLDTHQWDAWGELFCEDVALALDPAASSDGLDPGPIGREALVRMRASMPIAQARHFGHMPDIALTGTDTARGSWSMIAHDRLADGTLRTSFGWYDDEFRLCADGQWRISKLGVSGIMTV